MIFERILRGGGKELQRAPQKLIKRNLAGYDDTKVSFTLFFVQPGQNRIVSDIMGQDCHFASSRISKLFFIALAGPPDFESVSNVISAVAEHFRQEHPDVFVKIQCGFRHYRPDTLRLQFTPSPTADSLSISSVCS